ncbi:MAG: acyl-CoA dehydrogenase family protein [Candidatus Marinimicrobia bacterium]|nr:acyl-CoA dehydrogenase family protein [Candidatus Neomarinimicrobiota bacterium]
MEQRYFTEEHRLLQGMVREFARSEVEPVASEMDRQGQFPTDLVAKLAKLMRRTVLFICRARMIKIV